MRRADREKDEKFALEVIDTCEYATICIKDDESDSGVFCVPISIAREGSSIFIHGAKKGGKARLLHGVNLIQLVCVSYNKVPKISQEKLNNYITNEPKKLGSNVYTTEYKSAIAVCEAHTITDDVTKMHALKLLCEKYTPNLMAGVELSSNMALGITNIYELKIKTLTSKEKVVKLD